MRPQTFAQRQGSLIRIRGGAEPGVNFWRGSRLPEGLAARWLRREADKAAARQQRRRQRQQEEEGEVGPEETGGDPRAAGALGARRSPSPWEAKRRRQGASPAPADGVAAGEERRAERGEGLGEWPAGLERGGSPQAEYDPTADAAGAGPRRTVSSSGAAGRQWTASGEGARSERGCGGLAQECLCKLRPVMKQMKRPRLELGKVGNLLKGIMEREGVGGLAPA
jgi:hypothetical protein